MKSGIAAEPILNNGVEVLETNIDFILSQNSCVKSTTTTVNTRQFCYTYTGNNYYFDYIDGMTWSEYLSSSYNNNQFQHSSSDYEEIQP